jgi:16S rRNA (guanine527-N7)-methyltransferase
MRLESLLDEESIELDKLTIDRLDHFATLLHEWNSIHNLTGAKSIDAIYRNIIDSLYPITFIDTPSTLLDVGTGAGFPGLVLAIALEHTEVVLAEPLKKRVSFLRYATIDIRLDSVVVQGSRVEDIDHKPFDLITSRAVTNTELLLELTKDLSDSSTAYLFYKGERVFDEIKSFKNQLNYDIVQKNRRNYLYIKP